MSTRFNDGSRERRENMISARRQKLIDQIQVRQQAYEELLKLHEAWLQESVEQGYSTRTFDRIGREVDGLNKEISKGKVANVPARFAKMKARVMASIPRKRFASTYHQLSTALQELVALNSEWRQSEPRSRKDQAAMHRHLRCLLLEIEAGNTENLTERFRLATTVNEGSL